MKRTFFKSAALAVALACPLFTSCYDDAWINAEIDRLDTKIEALEKKLNDEVTALQQLVSGLVTVKDVAEDEATGVVTITLSNGETIEVQPAYEDARTLVTYIEDGGVKYWASCGQDGKKTPILDADGERIPVDKATPQVKEENGIVYISLDRGETWVETGNTLFNGAEIIYTDMYTDEQEEMDPEYYVETPMCVVITLADGSTFTVTLDGVAYFAFEDYKGRADKLFVSYGLTAQQGIKAQCIEDYVITAPMGWKVETGVSYGEPFVMVTAPSKEAVAAGSAVAGGYVQAVAVAEGGKTIVAKMFATTQAFQNVGLAKDQVNITPTFGLESFFYGVAPVAEFDAEAIMTTIMDEISGWRYSYARSYGEPIEGDMTEFVEAPVFGDTYVVWAVPMLYDRTYGEYYVVEGSLVSSEVVYHKVAVETVEVSFNNIVIDAKLEGVEMFYADWTTTEYLYDDYVNYWVASVNEGGWFGPSPIFYEDIVSYYEGHPAVFANSWDTDILPDTEYQLMLIPAFDGKKYTVDDVYIYTYKTDPLVAGGTIKLTAGEPVLDYTSIDVELSTEEEASFLYYAWVEPELMTTITDKAAYLLEMGTMQTYLGSLRRANMKANTSVVLLAMAVDTEGKYGEVFEQTYTTKEMTYNDVVVTVTPAEAEEEGQLAFTLSADSEVTKFAYWIGEKDSYYYDTYMGGTAEGASEYMALHPNMYWIKSATPDAPTVTFNNPDFAVEYVVVAQAVVTDAEGNTTYSKATVHEFQVEYPLGNYVNEDDAKWAEAKPTIEVIRVEAREFVEAAWSVTVPEGYTVVRSLCLDPEYLASQPSAKDKTVWLLTQDMFGDYSYGMYVDTDIDGNPLEQPYYSCHYASAGYMIYVVIKDAEGNHYQYYEYDPQITADGGFGV